MEPVLIGYFPKHIERRPDWFNAAGVEEICSVSECVSESPDGWIDHWLHNEWWAFRSVEVARRVLPADRSRADYEILAYRMFPAEFDEGLQTSFMIAPLDVEPLSEQFTSLGFDAVSRCSGAGFECSPLSCNHGAEEYAVNQCCLVDDVERIFKLARVFSTGEWWEPGPYDVVEVLRGGGGQKTT